CFCQERSSGAYRKLGRNCRTTSVLTPRSVPIHLIGSLRLARRLNYQKDCLQTCLTEMFRIVPILTRVRLAHTSLATRGVRSECIRFCAMKLQNALEYLSFRSLTSRS